LSTNLHDELISRLQYFDGHSDTLGVFADAGFLARAAGAVAAPFREAPVLKVAGIEAQGFVLATAVALELGAGLVTIRKRGRCTRAEGGADRAARLARERDRPPAGPASRRARSRAAVGLAEELRGH